MVPIQKSIVPSKSWFSRLALCWSSTKLKKDTPKHRQGGASANFQIVNCFTGYGRASVYELNKAVAALPNFSDCIPHLEKAFPDFTLAKLKAAVENATK